MLLPLLLLFGFMFVMTRSAKNKQRQAAQMRDQMQPGSGVRTIGGMYATVKEVSEDTVLLEVAPAVHAVYAKNAIAAVLDDAEYNRIIHGIDPDAAEIEVPDDASALTADEEPRVDLGKSETADADTEAKDDEAEGGAKGEADEAEPDKSSKSEGDANAK